MDIVGNRTLRDLWDDLAAHSGNRVFLDFEDRTGRPATYTYGQFDRLINRTANFLRSLGVGPGDAVAVQLANCPELLQVQFGLAKLGALFVPLHPRAGAPECADAVERTSARAVVCEPDLAPAYGPGRIEVDHVVVARGAGPLPGTIAFEPARDAQPEVLADPPALTGDTDACVVFTSGTTARPKGVLVSHTNMLFSGLFVDWQVGLRPADRLATTMPACHVNFQLNALMPVLTAGATLIALERYSARRFWRQVCDYEATVVQSIAMMVRTQLMQPEADWERRHHVREVLYYLPITDAEKARFEERFNTRILNSYGTSELLVGVITDPPVGERRWPSIGRVGLGYEARIAAEDGTEAAPGVVGEIQVRGVPGRTVMKGYLDDPEATAAAYAPGGWMRTGDLGHTDQDGWFYFADRRTHLIKRSGENISPAEVEAVLALHPGIVEAAVIGVSDPIHDQAVMAYVVPVAGARPTAAEVRAHCRAHLAEFKVPTIVEFVDALAQTGSFKVARTKLGPAPAGPAPAGPAAASVPDRAGTPDRASTSNRTNEG